MDWQNLTAAQRRQVYRERERFAMARTVASLLRETDGSNLNDMSAMTGNSIQLQCGTQASNEQGQVNQNNRQNSAVSHNYVSQAMSRRGIIAYTVMSRRRAINQIIAKMFAEVKQCNAELDSHTNTCGVNEVARILEYPGQVAEVSGFANSLEPLKNVPVVKAAVAIDNPETGDSAVLVINQALYFGDQLDNVLLNPNQMRFHGVTVNNVPRFLSKGKSRHCITIKEAGLEILLKLNVIISYFPIQTPTNKEFQELDLIPITSDVEWNPHSVTF